METESKDINTECGFIVRTELFVAHMDPELRPRTL